MSSKKKLFGKKGTLVLHKKKVPKGSKSYILLEKKRATLHAGDFSDSIRLPPDTPLDDWLAANTVDFYNELVVLMESLLDYCSPDTCTSMCAGPKYQYLWQDGSQYKSPTSVPAHTYITLLFQWVDELFENKSVFPPDPEVPFPKNFKDVVKSIFKRLFRVYAHFYYHHLKDVREAELEANFNTSFRHFYCFVKEFNLISSQELEPLKEIIESFSSSS